MNYRSIIISVFCVAYMLTAVGMENKKLSEWVCHLTEIEKIPVFETPLCVCYVFPDVVAISDVNKCYLQNLKTKEVTCIDDTRGYWRFGDQALESKNGKLFVSNDRGIMIYNMHTNQPDWSMLRKKCTDSVAWDYVQNKVFICYGAEKRHITTYDYSANTRKDIPMNDKICYLMTIHSAQQIMCIADYANTISLHALGDLALVRKTIVLPKDNEACIFCQYSPHGDYVISGNKKKLYIVHFPHENAAYRCLQAPEAEEFRKIAFHPHKSVLATLNTLYTPSDFHGCRQQIIRYWDLKTLKLIQRTPDLISINSYDLSFSEDGLHIIVALAKKCLKMPVFWAMKERGLYLLFTLHMQLAKQYNIPKDITDYCLNILCKLLCFYW